MFDAVSTFRIFSSPQGSPTLVAAADALDPAGSVFSLRCATCSKRLTGCDHLRVITHHGDDHRYCGVDCHARRGGR